MIYVNIRIPPRIGSLRYCGELLQKYLLKSNLASTVTLSTDYIEGRINIGVDDFILALVHNRKCDIAWMDTPLYYTQRIKNTYSRRARELCVKFYTTSKFNEEIAKELGFRVDGIIPRLINEELFNIDKFRYRQEYDIITIGNYDSVDRKNLRLQRDLLPKLGVKAVFISNIWLPRNTTIVQYRTGTVSEELKIELLAKSKFLLWTSFVEGFGMPVLEAMAVGTIPIYSDVPAHNEFAVGIPIKPIDHYIACGYGTRIHKWIIDPDSVEEAIKYALGLSKEEYQDLSAKCREKALQIYNTTTSKIPDLLKLDKSTKKEIVEEEESKIEILYHNI